MVNKSEIVVRVFDGVDGNSSLLIGHDAQQALLSRALSRMLHQLGVETRKVVNTQAVSEVELRTRYDRYTAIAFPDGTTVGDKGIDLYQARIALETRPPLDDATIQKIGPYIAKLLHDEKCDFALLDDRGDAHIEELYVEPYSAYIIPFPTK